MFVADPDGPALSTILWTMLGGYLAPVNRGPNDTGYVIYASPSGEKKRKALLERFDRLTVLGLDRDQQALALATARLARFGDRLVPVHTVYDRIGEVVADDGADARLTFLNADGSESGACGNGMRCIAQLVANESGKQVVNFETRTGLSSCRIDRDMVTVDMGTPRFDWHEIPLAEEFRDTRHIELQIGPIDTPVLHSPSAVNVGNPHVVFWVDDVNAYDLARLGPLLENHPIFPERANVSLCKVVARDHLVVRTWERGAGLTRFIDA